MTVTEERITFCRICKACCGMVATVEDGRVTKLRADRDNPFSDGYVCPKGPAYLEVHNDPDRVVHPLKRQPDGTFTPVSWDDALDDIAGRRRELRSHHTWFHNVDKLMRDRRQRLRIHPKDAAEVWRPCRKDGATGAAGGRPSPPAAPTTTT